METINQDNSIKYDKKGITPLMATFLLISFGVAVGVFFTNLARAQAEQSAICPVDIGLSQNKLCYDGQQIIYTVENGINTEIKGLVFSVIGTEEAKTIEVNDLQMYRGGIYSGVIAYDQSVSGVIRQIKITPKIALDGEQLICLEQGMVMETVSDC